MPKPPDLIDKIKVKRRHEAALLAKPGVLGVSVGLLTKGGKRSKDVGIRVLVPSTAEAPADLPDKIEGLSIELVPVGKPLANSQNTLRPLKGGASFSGETVSQYGTMGAVVADTAGSALALTSFHVLAPACALSTSAKVVQPANFDGGQQVVGSAARWYFHPGSAGATGIDAAVARIPPEVPVSFNIENYGAILGQASAALGELVTKVGRTTDRTYGIVTDLSTTIAVTFDFGSKTFFDQISVTVTAPSSVVAASGDSGAIWLNGSGQAVGLHMATNGAGTIAYANPFHSVANRLAFTVQSPVTADPSRIYRVRAD